MATKKTIKSTYEIAMCRSAPTQMHCAELVEVKIHGV
jgi:hypothetical protein